MVRASSALPLAGWVRKTEVSREWLWVKSESVLNSGEEICSLLPQGGESEVCAFTWEKALLSFPGDPKRRKK